MKHFKQLVKELPAKKVVFTFGRFQPPTIGHGLLVAAVKHIAQKQGADHVIYASRSQDKKSNPLPVDRKVYYLKRMFPGTNFVGADEQVRTFMEAAKELNKKYKNLVMIAGSDRVPEYKKLLEKYNGKEFHFDTIEVVSAGERDPDADGASGMSGTKMREAAKKGDFESFKRGLPSTLTTVDSKRLMNELREHMGIEAVKEEVNLPKTDLRERYHAGEIFNVDQIVECAGVVYQIKKRGSNHLLLQDQEGNMVSKWITDVTESTQEFTLLQGLNEMKYTSADKIKVARVIANALGVVDVDKSSNAELLINNALRKIRSKPMRPEYIDVLHKMLVTAQEAGIAYDEKLVPQKVAEGVKQPNGTDKVGGIVNEISKETLKSYIPKAMGSKSAADFTRGVKMAQGSGGEEELRKKSEKRSEGIHRAIKKLTKEELEEATEHKTYGYQTFSKTDKSKWVADGSIKAKSPEHAKKLAQAKHPGTTAHVYEFDKEDLEEGAPKTQYGTGWMLRADPELKKKVDAQVKGVKALKKFSTKKEVKEETQIDESTVEFRIDHRDKIKGDHKPTFDSHDAKVGDITDKATYVNVPSHKAKSFKSAMKSKHGVNVELSEEVQIEEGKMGELHDTISRHLDKHISDFKSGHTGMDQFGSKVLAAHKSVAKEHGLEHKHAAKFVNDYVDSKLNEEAITEWTVKHDGVDADHPHAKLFHGKKDVINHLTKYKDSAEKRAELLKNKGFKNVRIDEVSFHTLDKAWHGRYQQALAAKHGSPEHQKAHKSMGKIGDVMKKRIDNKLMHMAKHDPEAYKKSAVASADQDRKRGWSTEQYEQISDLLEQIATASMLNKDTTELKKKLSLVRHDVKNNDSDIEADHQAEPVETKIGQSVTAPHESDTVRKMKIRQMSEEVEELDEDQATAEYKVKTYYDNATGKTKTRKIRPHRVTFSGSKNGGEPEVDSPGEAVKNEAFAGTIIPGTDISSNKKMKEGIDGVPAGDMGAMPVGAPDAYSADAAVITKDLKDKLRDKKALKLKEDHEEDDHEEITDAELDRMADSITDLDDIIDAYDDDELHIVDDNGDHVDELKEETINEVLSRAERIKARVRFAQSKAKRERKIQIALKTPSSMSKLNGRARKLAVKLMKQRIVRKPLSSLSTSEKERVEAMVAKRKKAIDRLAMKLVSRVKKIEQTRLHRG